MEKKKIAVIMTVHNRKKDTLQCMAYLEKQRLPNDSSYDVWITDDGCTDGTRDALKGAYPYVHIVDGDGNLYWNRGMWKAWDKASKSMKYNFYLWLNDDIVLYDYAVSDLMRESIKHNNQCIIVGSTQAEDHSGVTYGGFWNHCLLTPNGRAEKVDSFNGNIVLVPESVFNTIGNLDPFFRHGHGDRDYGLRAKEVGIDSFIVGRYLGECDRHEKVKKCWDPNVPFLYRYKNLYQPTGYPPKETFYYQKKHYGYITAFSHVIKSFGRLLFPQLWAYLGKNKA